MLRVERRLGDDQPSVKACVEYRETYSPAAAISAAPAESVKDDVSLM
jgi:hypothetical protein